MSGDAPAYRRTTKRVTHGARRRPGVPGDDLGIPTDPEAWPDAGPVGSHRFGRAVHMGDANAGVGSVWSFEDPSGLGLRQLKPKDRQPAVS